MFGCPSIKGTVREIGAGGKSANTAAFRAARSQSERLFGGGGMVKGQVGNLAPVLRQMRPRKQGLRHFAPKRKGAS